VGTYDDCTPSENFDHVLLSPALSNVVTAGLIFRKDAWGGLHGDMWDHYPEVGSREQAASDHCAVYVDLALS